MEVTKHARVVIWLLLLPHIFVVRSARLELTNNTPLKITRNNNGDIFSQETDPKAPCTEDTCVGLSSGTATALSVKDRCTCHCHPHLPTFREDLRICVDDIHECTLAPFVSASTSQQIPFVFLPLKGQIIHPSKEIFFGGMHMPVCAISGAKFMTEDGWIDLRNPVDTDVPFRLFRDEGRTFLQWAGDTDLRNKMFGRLVMVNLMCREVPIANTKETNLETIFSPCVAFRVVGTPTKHVSNVSEVAFVPDAHGSENLTSDNSMSVSEYVAIGIASVLLGLIYVASVFLFLHLRKRSRSNESKKSTDSPNLRTTEEGIVKNNPLLSVPAHFIQTDTSYSDTNSSDNDLAPDIIKHHEDRKMQITSAMVHHQKQYLSSHRSPFTMIEFNHTDSSTNERLPEENVSIVETLENREDRPESLRSLTGSTRKKLYFNPAYFEPQLLMTPPPAALEFLTKIREVIALAKQKMAAKRYTPSLLNIPEEENCYTLDPTYELSKSTSRRNSNISLKRENSRRKPCTGCAGCGSQDLNCKGVKVPELPVITPCENCTVGASESKHTIVRKWLEDVPIIRSNSDIPLSREAISSSFKSPRRLRSPTKSLPMDEFDDQVKVMPPRPASMRYPSAKDSNRHSMKIKKVIKKPNHPPPPPIGRKATEVENIYDTVSGEEKREMNFPPPDMIKQAMEVDRSGEKIATLTKKQMNAVINEFTTHRSIIIPQLNNETCGKNDEVVDYEADSLERSAKRGFSTPTEYSEISSSQPSPSLSTALPDHEEMTMRNAVFNKKTGNMTISKIQMDSLQEDEHDYELIVMKKGSLKTQSYSLPELLQRNNGYSLVSEVYVNSGYNYGSAPSTPGGSNYSTLERKTLTVRYEEGQEKPGKLLIEVEDCPDNYIPVHESDQFEPDTLDRKPSRNKINEKSKLSKSGYTDSLERPSQILLRTTGSFRSDAPAPKIEEVEPSNFNRVFGSLREIYEAKTKGKQKDDMDIYTLLSDDEKGRILTLDERHARRQRAKNAQVQPDVIPPPPMVGGSPIYEHPKPPRRVIVDNDVISQTNQSKNLNGRSVSQLLNAPINNTNSCFSTGTPDKKTDDDYDLYLLQKSRKDGNITNLIQTEDIILKKGSNDQFILHSILYPCTMRSDKSVDEKKLPKHTWRSSIKPEDSGYLSSDSNESRVLLKHKDTVSLTEICSETDESLGDGHSESGAESVETHSVFFNRFYRQQPPSNSVGGGYGSMDSGVMGGEEGQTSSDSENVSYTTVVPVTSI